jgi:16S rRNA (cytosine967-C5)-methyltransferase
VEALLLLGLYQLFEGDVPPHAAIGETVEAARALEKPWAVPLLNGVLRTALRSQEGLLATLDRHPAAAAAHPEWLYDAIRAAWPDDFAAILTANNQPPAMTLRVNTQACPREDYLQRLEEAGIAAHACAFAPAGVVLEHSCSPVTLPGFAAGLCSVQDGGAQLAALALSPAPADRSLDACAAPGGKACHLLEGGAKALTALDVDPERLLRIEENLHRLRLTALVLAGDATHPEDWWDQRPYQRILVDAPCSGTGVMRRHPDIKLLRRPEDIPVLAAHQWALLQALWPLLAPGGRLVYATCSILPAENDAVIEAFLAEHPEATVADPLAALGDVGRRLQWGRQILPGEADMDGFYYAALDRPA